MNPFNFIPQFILTVCIVAFCVPCNLSAQGSTDPNVAPEWILDAQGCKVWNPNPKPKETITWSGRCKDGLANGYGTIKWFLNDQPNETHEGTFQDGKLNGQGVITYANGVRKAGTWSNGVLPNGAILFPNGNKYEGPFVQGQATGNGVFTWAGGDRYTGEFINGKRQGKGVLQSVNGAKYEGNFVDGKLSGHAVLTKADGTRIAGTGIDGKFTPDVPNGGDTVKRVGDDSSNEKADKTCRSYGLQKATAAYVDCMLRIREQDLRQSGNQAQSAEQLEIDAERVRQLERERIRAEAAERDRLQELARQRKAQEQLVLACKSAMLLRPTRSGSFGESLTNANQCDADPQAHLRPAAPNYTCRRDAFGNLNCNPY